MATVSPALILASASPRRVQLLAQIGITPAAIMPADSDESAWPGELPLRYVERISRAKATIIAAQKPDDLVLAADTVVAVGRRILPKAETADQVRDCLQLLSGRRHRVLTGVTLQLPDGSQRYRLSTTIVRVKRLSAAEMDAYIAGGEGIGAAGGYKIQGSFASLIIQLAGSHSGVMGLPLYETAQLLKSCGILSA